MCSYKEMPMSSPIKTLLWKRWQDIGHLISEDPEPLAVSRGGLWRGWED